jgi:hypothetical protein
MKKSVFALGLCVLMTQFVFAQIKVTSAGYVGIGTQSPSCKVTMQGDNILLRSNTNNSTGILFTYLPGEEAFDISPTSNGYNSMGANQRYDVIYGNMFDGEGGWFNSLYTFNFYDWSDIKLKKNINNLSFDKSAFSKLHPVSYEICDSLLLNKNQRKNKKAVTTTKYGFIAQELQELYPQLVSTDEVTGFLKVKPLELIPILVSAIKDQQTQISDLETRLSKLENNSSSAPAKVGALHTPDANVTDVLTYPVLDQNIPNPFNISTTIGYYLPTTITNASIYVYDMNGVQLKSYSITEKGKGTVTIQGSEFNAGMYLYALIADGKVIDTKRMILTK